MKKIIVYKKDKVFYPWIPGPVYTDYILINGGNVRLARYCNEKASENLIWKDQQFTKETAKGEARLQRMKKIDYSTLPDNIKMLYEEHMKYNAT